jgi:hypothetical protein
MGDNWMSLLTAALNCNGEEKQSMVKDKGSSQQKAVNKMEFASII